MTRKLEPTTIFKGSDGKYKIKPQEVLREEESENDEGSSIFHGPSLLTQSNRQDFSQHRTEEYFENEDAFGILSENMDIHEETYTDPIDTVIAEAVQVSQIWFQSTMQTFADQLKDEHQIKGEG